MYICICNAVTDRQIRACARSGACSFADVREKLAVGASCGKCARDAKEILRDEATRADARGGAPMGLIDA